MKTVKAPNPTASAKKSRMESQLCMGPRADAPGGLVKIFASRPTLMLLDG